MATIEELTARLDEALKRQPVSGHSLKVDFKGEGTIFASDSAASNSDAPADCTLRIAKADFDAMLAGQIDPSTAARDGTLEVIGNPGAALAMQQVLVAAWLTPRT